MTSACKLRPDIRIPHDRSRDKLRKHRNIQCQIDRIFLDHFFIPVHIDAIGHSLKRIKRNSNRQRYIRHMQKIWNHLIYIFNKKSAVFEYAKDKQVDNNGNDHPQLILPCVGNKHAKQIIVCNGGKHDQDIDRLSPCIKKQTADQQKHIFCRLRNQIITDNNNR